LQPVRRLVLVRRRCAGVGELTMTLMGCPEPIGSIEAAFVATLTALKSASMDDSGRLVLDGPGGQVLLVRAG
jgi:hypothetical protein